MSNRPSLIDQIHAGNNRKSMVDNSKQLNDNEMKEKLDILEAKLMEMERNELNRQSSLQSQNLKEIMLTIPETGSNNDRKISTKSNLSNPSPKKSVMEKNLTANLRSSQMSTKGAEVELRAKSVDKSSTGKKSIRESPYSDKKMSKTQYDDVGMRVGKAQNYNQAERLEIKKQEIITFIKTRMKNIFMFYTSFGDRLNASLLKSNKFHKMLVDANIREGLDPTKLDLLFVSENKHKANMNFETFLNMIPGLAALKYPNMTQGEAISALVEKHFLPLYNSIMQETDLGEEEEKLRDPIDLQTLLVLKFVSPVLRKIYQVPL
jgi:hypothetical protein